MVRDGSSPSPVGQQHLTTAEPEERRPSPTLRLSIRTRHSSVSDSGSSSSSSSASDSGGSLPSVLKPASTIQGRSGYFGSPHPQATHKPWLIRRRQLEVQIPRLSSEDTARYTLVREDSVAPSALDGRGAAGGEHFEEEQVNDHAKPDLSQFRYTGSKLSRSS